MPDAGRRGGDNIHELFVVDLSRGEAPPRVPNHHCGPYELAAGMPIEHWAAGEDDRGKVDRCRSHETCRRRLVAARRQDNAIERIAVKHFDKTEIGKIAVEGSGRALTRLLDRMDGEFDWNAAGIADPVAHALRKLEMMPIVNFGFGAWSVLGWMVLTGFGFFRQLSYEFFVLQHIASFTVLLWLVYEHVPSYAKYNVWLAISFVALDRGGRSILLVTHNLHLWSRKAKQQKYVLGFSANAEKIPV